jgi:hypothetical protein
MADLTKVTDGTEANAVVYDETSGDYRYTAQYMVSMSVPEGWDSEELPRLVMLRVEQKRGDNLVFAQIAHMSVTLWNLLCDDWPMLKTYFDELKALVDDMEV